MARNHRGGAQAGDIFGRLNAGPLRGAQILSVIMSGQGVGLGIYQKEEPGAPEARIDLGFPIVALCCDDDFYRTPPACLGIFYFCFCCAPYVAGACLLFEKGFIFSARRAPKTEPRACAQASMVS